MSREGLVKKIAEEAGVTKKVATLALNAVIGGIQETLKAGDKVTLIGFGTFSVKKRPARTGVNPQTKKKIKIPAKKVPVFKAGAKLKEAVK
ncbi:MAG: HU family DNA-binding protein [Candidatus Cloacimonetes bacterium]|nr:HU family DNA-binding protein [Candidatus Cloacimonadota bacterium]